MKKILLIVTAVLMVFGAVGNAAAYFDKDSGHIIMSVYKEEGAEVGIDLGHPDNISGASAGSLSLGLFESGTTWDQLNVGIWGQTFSFSEVSGSFYYATTTDADPGFSLNGIGGFDASNYQVIGYYKTFGILNANVSVGEVSHVLSYDYKFNANSNAPGSYAFTKPPKTAPGETDLSALSTGGSVTMYLHEYTLEGEVFVYAGATPITLNADGSVSVGGSGDPPNLGDVIKALQVTVGLEPANLPADRNGDSIIGLEDAVFILQGVAGSR
jgi:hypothetical protein